MSDITDIILILNIRNNDEFEKVRFINLYLQSEYGEIIERSTAEGGTKVFTGSVYTGSYNLFNKYEFITFVQKTFNSPNDAFQIFFRDEDSYQFEIAAVKVPTWS